MSEPSRPARRGVRVSHTLSSARYEPLSPCRPPTPPRVESPSPCAKDLLKSCHSMSLSAADSPTEILIENDVMSEPLRVCSRSRNVDSGCGTNSNRASMNSRIVANAIDEPSSAAPARQRRRGRWWEQARKEPNRAGCWRRGVWVLRWRLYPRDGLQPVDSRLSLADS